MFFLNNFLAFFFSFSCERTFLSNKKKPLISEWLHFVKWWSRSESNQRHMDFQSIALPTELRDHLVAGEGFEPTTSGLWARRATRLLYPAMFNEQFFFSWRFKWRRNWDSNPGASFPTYRFSRPDPSTTWVFLQMFGNIMVDPVGLEPTTHRLWAGCSDQLS